MTTFRPREFLNRELSWLAFNERVLEEAEDSRTPPLNQLAFLSIVSSNLDEFVMIRLAGLRQLQQAGRSSDCPTGMDPGEQIERIGQAVRDMVARQYDCFNGKVWPALARHGLRRLDSASMDEEQRRHLTALFEEQIYPLLTPLAIDDTRKFSRVPDLTINVLVRLRDGSGAERTAIVPIPAGPPRMIMVPSDRGHCFALLEDVVLMCVGRLFEGHQIVEAAIFRVARDSDMSVEESRDEDFLDAMAEVLVQRRESRVVRLELPETVSPWALRFLQKLLGVGDAETFRVAGPLDLKAWFALADLPGLSPLRYPAWEPQPSPAQMPPDADIWETIRKGDVLLHHPYESFDAVIRLIQEAANDRNVLAIKQVLYRTSGGSKVIAALEQAALNGKQVSVLVELKARFDEARNIEWARRLERAGAQVVYGLAGLKVHAKALLIVRRDPDRIRRYVHMATGNYNESTAGQYTDFGLITCDDDFGADAAAFFNMITGFSQPAAWRKIFVAPLGLRQRIVHMIQREAQRAQAGRNASIMAKLNSLADTEIIEALYAASRAGVRIRLNVRGVCCLRPGVRGVSENIEVVSIVDRFLEHGRVLYFRNGGEEEVYLSSADWMPRNLDRRVELLFPIESPPLKRRLIDALEVFLRDGSKGRKLQPSGKYVRPKVGRRKLSAQETFMQMAEAAARKMREQTPKEFRVIRPPERPEA